MATGVCFKQSSRVLRDRTHAVQVNSILLSKQTSANTTVQQRASTLTAGQIVLKSVCRWCVEAEEISYRSWSQYW